MTRLPFKLPEYDPRVIYVSTLAREVWAPRISAISNAWIALERDSVAAGIRTSALQYCSYDELPALLAREAQRGLLVLPLSKAPAPSGYRSATGTGPQTHYRIAITRPEHAAAWTQAWAKQDDHKIGELLSTPPCCRDAFDRYWKQERWFDLTWPTRSTETSSGRPEIGHGLSESDAYNGLLRWLGVRGVSHLPCSPTCAPTLALQGQLLGLMATSFPNEADWLRQMLSWPTLWTSLGGIAEITNPILRMSVPSDALASKAEVRHEGTGYPVEGASGTTFPFRLIAPQSEPQPLPFLHKKNVSQGTPEPSSSLLGRPLTEEEKSRVPTAFHWLRVVPTGLGKALQRCNGFNTVDAMNKAHQELLQTLWGAEYRTVLDLGCGDGTLLTKIPCTRRVGIESDPHVAKEAETRLDRVIVGDCTDAALLSKVLSEEYPDLVIAQRDRNPADTLRDYPVLSYSYENGADPPILHLNHKRCGCLPTSHPCRCCHADAAGHP